MTIAAASFHVGLERGTREPSPEPDAEHPRDEHDSHAWETGPRWRECSRCRARDYWTAASVRCAGASRDDEEITIAEALDVILADLAAFETWWRGRSVDLGLARPSFAEWRAEFFEWARANGASARA